MRPVPISEAQVQALGGGLRRVLAAPSGDLTDPNCAPLEVVIQQLDDGTHVYSSLWTIEGDDLRRLRGGARIRLVVFGGQPPVDLSVV